MLPFIARDLRMTDRDGILTLPVFVMERGGPVIPALHHRIADSIGIRASGVIQCLLPGLLPPAARAVCCEAAAVLVVLILPGRTPEARAKRRTGAAFARWPPGPPPWIR